jgi:hypothetical protein
MLNGTAVSGIDGNVMLVRGVEVMYDVMLNGDM